MKILIICNNSSGLLLFRGMLISELIKAGNSVDAIVPKSDENIEVLARKDLKKLNCNLTEVSMQRRSTNPFQDLSLAANYRKIIKRIKPQFVITYTIKPNVYGGIVCRLLNIDYAANITGVGTAFQTEGLLRKIATVLNKVALKKAKVVFFENSENLKTFVDLKIIKSSKACVLNGAGVDIEKFNFADYPEDDETTRFLFVGRVMKEKGFEELFEAVTRLNNEGEKVLLDIVGPYEDDYKNAVEELEAKGIAKYHGYQEDVKPFIINCNCFVLPSYHEGMANTNLECASMGRPIITSAIHGCLEAVIEDKSGFLCKPQDSQDLYLQLKRFINLPYECKARMGRAGRKHIEDVFDKRKVVKETMNKLFE